MSSRCSTPARPLGIPSSSPARPATAPRRSLPPPASSRFSARRAIFAGLKRDLGVSLDSQSLRRRRVRQRLQSPRLNLELTNLVFLYLPAKRRRKLGDEANVFGNLVVGDLAFAEFLDLLFCSFGAGLQTHPCGHNLAQSCVGNADYLRLADLGVRVEKLLHLARIDIFSAANNHVLGASSQVDATVRVHHAQVAGMQPAIFLDHFGS